MFQLFEGGVYAWGTFYRIFDFFHRGVFDFHRVRVAGGKFNLFNFLLRDGFYFVAFSVKVNFVFIGEGGRDG